MFRYSLINDIVKVRAGQAEPAGNWTVCVGVSLFWGGGVSNLSERSLIPCIALWTLDMQKVALLPWFHIQAL